MQKKDLKFNDNKGIALITLIVAVLMMLIISSIIIYNTTNNIKIQSLNNMYNDIRLLGEQVFLYKSKYDSLPILDNEYASGLPSQILQEYESDRFHVIDIDRIDRNIKSNLKYGKDYYNKNYSGTNIYIINTDTFQIFYVRGIKVDDKIYYTIPNEDNEYQKLLVDEVGANPPELKEDFTPITYSENKIVPTNKYDKNWYNYSELGDLSKWARAQVTDNELYMWIPRYAYNKNSNEIVFLKGKTNTPVDTNKTIDDKWEIPYIFIDEDNEELTGIWLSINEYKEINSKDDLINKVNNLIGKDNINGTANITVTGKNATYYNPIVPVGFKTIQTDTASWRSNDGVHINGWNDGLVIEDKDGNQFVWVPVDGTNVKYEKWLGNKNTEGLTAISQVQDKDTLPSGIDEIKQITKYGGFYIARYEAGIPESMAEALNNLNKRNVSGKPVSKKNQVPWNYVNYTNSKANAESMYNTADVKSSLVTGTMWDTVMLWLKNSGIDVETNSKEWGNYYNAPVTEITEYSEDYGANWIKVSSISKKTSTSWLLKTGHSDYTKRKNIYDLAGNLWEWTNEIYNINTRICRAGDWDNLGQYGLATYRSPTGVLDSINNATFRVALYIQ